MVTHKSSFKKYLTENPTQRKKYEAASKVHKLIRDAANIVGIKHKRKK